MRPESWNYTININILTRVLRPMIKLFKILNSEEFHHEVSDGTHRLELKGELPIVLFSLVLVFSLSCAT